MGGSVPKNWNSRRTLQFERIVADLRGVTRPYESPWRGLPPVPWNYYTGRLYGGLNSKTLVQAQSRFGYSPSRWLTSRQADLLGGRVREREFGTKIIFAKRLHFHGLKPSRGIVREFFVFHTSQCDGLPNDRRPLEPTDYALQRFFSLISALPIDMRRGGIYAFFDAQADFIQLPDIWRYAYIQNDMPRTTLHEIAHWAMDTRRLDIRSRGDHKLAQYAWNEIIAELATWFVLAELQITPSTRAADYIADWYRCTKSSTILMPVEEATRSIAEEAARVADHILSFERLARLTE